MAGGGGSGGLGSFLPTALAIGASIAAPELAPAFLSESLGTTAAVGLTGAALGGGAAALTGGNVGQGALMGGLGGALTGSGILGGGSSLTGPEATNVGIDAIPVGTPAQAAPDLLMGNAQAEFDPNAWGSEVGTNPANAAKDVNFVPGQNVPGAPPTAGGWDSLSKMQKAGIVGAGGLAAVNMLGQQPTLNTAQAANPVTSGLDYKFDRNTYQPSVAPNYNGIAGLNTGPAAQRLIGYGYGNPRTQNLSGYGYADGGSIGTVEEMSRENATGGNQMFPQSGLGGLTGANTYQNATNTPTSSNLMEPTDAVTDPYTGAMKFATGGQTKTSPTQKSADTQQGAYDLNTIKQYIQLAQTPIGLKQVTILADNGDDSATQAIYYLKNQPVTGPEQAGLGQTAQASMQPSAAQSPMQQAPVQAAHGGIMGYARGGSQSLGSYSDGGQMLKGPGDGMSDSIPAKIGRHQPARLADGEFVVPADVVSHLGNGSTDAGAKHLYSMMDKVRAARTGRKTQGKQIKPEKYMPA